MRKTMKICQNCPCSSPSISLSSLASPCLNSELSLSLSLSPPLPGGVPHLASPPCARHHRREGLRSARRCGRLPTLPVPTPRPLRSWSSSVCSCCCCCCCSDRVDFVPLPLWNQVSSGFLWCRVEDCLERPRKKKVLLEFSWTRC
jgi:hypothetical protein